MERADTAARDQRHALARIDALDVCGAAAPGNLLADRIGTCFAATPPLLLALACTEARTAAMRCPGRDRGPHREFHIELRGAS